MDDNAETSGAGGLAVLHAGVIGESGAGWLQGTGDVPD